MNPICIKLSSDLKQSQLIGHHRYIYFSYSSLYIFIMYLFQVSIISSLCMPLTEIHKQIINKTVTHAKIDCFYCIQNEGFFEPTNAT